MTLLHFLLLHKHEAKTSRTRALPSCTGDIRFLVSFGSSANTEAEGFMTSSVTSLQEEIGMFWLHVWAVLPSSIFIYSPCFWMKQSTCCCLEVLLIRSDSGLGARPQQADSAILWGRADWQVLGGVKTSGSLMPSCRLKKRVEVVTLLFLV